MALPLCQFVSRGNSKWGSVAGDVHVSAVQLQGEEGEHEQGHDEEVDSEPSVSLDPHIVVHEGGGWLPPHQRLLLLLSPFDLLDLLIAPAGLALGQGLDVFLVDRHGVLWVILDTSRMRVGVQVTRYPKNKTKWFQTQSTQTGADRSGVVWCASTTETGREGDGCMHGQTDRRCAYRYRPVPDE